MGKSFRKSLGIFNYKIGNKTHKKPGVIPFHIKKSLLEVYNLIKLINLD